MKNATLLSMPLFLAILQSQLIMALNMSYHGGPVIHQVEVQPIYYGFVTNQENLTRFYSYIVQSSVMDVIAQEYKPPNSAAFKNGTMMQPIQAMEYGKTIMDDIKDIRPFLRTLIRENRITPTINTYFPIHFQKDIDVTRNGDKSCRDFCSYHSTMDIRNLNISDVPYLFYGVIPDITSALCFNGKTCGPYNAFQNTCLIASHELFEAITNPMVGVAHNGARYPVAWYSADKEDKNTSGEVADMCKDIGFEVGSDEDGSKWVIQTVWSNKAQRCVATPV